MIVVGNKIQIKIDETTAGNLDLSSNPTAIESGIIIGIGFEVDDILKSWLAIGKKILFKSWALDIITYQSKQYYFIDADSKGICAIFNEETRDPKN